jgi:hypothetical protein
VALPTYKGSGTFTAGTTSITPPMPTGGAAPAANDILLLVCESENQAITLTTANGFVEITNSPQGTGTGGTTGSTRLAVFWKRAVGSDAAPVVADSGDHTSGQIHCFAGVRTSGNPWDVTAGGLDTTSDTSGSIPGATTTVNDCLVVLLCSTSDNATSTANFSGWSNANLANVTERTDNANTAGLGGGHGMATGELATAGAYAASSVTLAVASLKGMMSIALAGAATVFTGAGAVVMSMPGIVAVAALTFAGAAGLTVGTPSVAGSGGIALPVTATAAVTVGKPAIAGSGTLTFSGTGAVTVAAPAIASAGTQFSTVTATAALTVTPPGIAGIGTITQASVTGTGTPVVPKPSIAGSGSLTFVGTGAASVAQPSIAGTGAETFAGVGTLGTPTTISGVGAETFHGTVAITVSAPVIEAGQGPQGGDAIAVHRLTVALPSFPVRATVLPPIQGMSVMDDFRCDNNTGTCDSTAHTADAAPMRG